MSEVADQGTPTLKGISYRTLQPKPNSSRAVQNQNTATVSTQASVVLAHLLLAVAVLLRLAKTLRLLDGAAEAAAALVEVVAVLVADLAAGLAAAVLAALLEARVQVGADDTLVQLGAADVLETVQGVLVRVVLDEAEAARRLVEPIQAHDQPLDFPALGEEVVDLLFRCVERAV